MIPQTPIREALKDPLLLGHVIADDSWSVWRTLLIAAMGKRLPTMSASSSSSSRGASASHCSASTSSRWLLGEGAVRPALWQCSYPISQRFAVTATLLREVRPAFCSALRKTSVSPRRSLDFVQADIEGSDILRGLFRSRRSDTIELASNINIEVRPASFRKLRGPTYIAVIADELAFWYTDSDYANPDDEILAAVRPGLLTTRGPLIMASSPYAKKGVLWDTYRKHYGNDGAPNVACRRAQHENSMPPYRRARSTASSSATARATPRSFSRNSAQTSRASCRSKWWKYVSDNTTNSRAAITSYHAFVDVASGSGKDAFAMAISHKAQDNIIIDCIREKRPPFKPSEVIAEFAPLLKQYRIGKIVGDRYAGGFPPEASQRCGIRYEPAKKTKSELYVDLLPLLNSARITLPRNDRLLSQIVGLERTVTRGSGKENIDHARDAHDDISNSVAGATMLALTHGNYLDRITKAFALDDADANKKPRLKLVGNHWVPA